MKHIYKIEGMTCGGCKASVEKHLNALENVTMVVVNLEKGEAIIKMGTHITRDLLQKALPKKFTISEKLVEMVSTFSNSESSAIANQTTFTLSQIPSENSKVKMYVNGIRISTTAYTYTSTLTSLTYESANNGGYALTVGDRIQFDYFY